MELLMNILSWLYFSNLIYKLIHLDKIQIFFFLLKGIIKCVKDVLKLCFKAHHYATML